MTEYVETWRCTHIVRGIGCLQPRSLEGGDLCCYHAKKTAGLFACPQRGCARKEGHRPPCRPIPDTDRHGLNPADEFSDERWELVAALKALGP